MAVRYTVNLKPQSNKGEYEMRTISLLMVFLTIVSTCVVSAGETPYTYTPLQPTREEHMDALVNNAVRSINLGRYLPNSETLLGLRTNKLEKTVPGDLEHQKVKYYKGERLELNFEVLKDIGWDANTPGFDIYCYAWRYDQAGNLANYYLAGEYGTILATHTDDNHPHVSNVRPFIYDYRGQNGSSGYQQFQLLDLEYNGGVEDQRYWFIWIATPTGGAPDLQPDLVLADPTDTRWVAFGGILEVDLMAGKNPNESVVLPISTIGLKPGDSYSMTPTREVWVNPNIPPVDFIDVSVRDSVLKVTATPTAPAGEYIVYLQYRNEDNETKDESLRVLVHESEDSDGPVVAVGSGDTGTTGDTGGTIYGYTRISDTVIRIMEGTTGVTLEMSEPVHYEQHNKQSAVKALANGTTSVVLEINEYVSAGSDEVLTLYDQYGNGTDITVQIGDPEDDSDSMSLVISPASITVDPNTTFTVGVNVNDAVVKNVPAGITIAGPYEYTTDGEMPYLYQGNVDPDAEPGTKRIEFVREFVGDAGTTIRQTASLTLEVSTYHDSEGSSTPDDGNVDGELELPQPNVSVETSTAYITAGETTTITLVVDPTDEGEIANIQSIVLKDPHGGVVYELPRDMGNANITGTPLPTTAGTWSITFTPAYDSRTDGDYTILVIGDWFDTVVKKFGVSIETPDDPATDTTAPTIAITEPTGSDTYYATGVFRLAGTASDDRGVSQVTVTLSGATTDSIIAAGRDSWSVSNLSVNPGTTTITVAATDAAGNSTSRSLDVIYNTVTIQKSTDSVMVGDTIVFTANTTGGTPTNYQWSVGGVVMQDGAANSYTHTAATVGTRSVSVLVTFSGGGTLTATDSFTVLGGPSVTVTGPNAVEIGSTIALAASTSGGSDTSYGWTSSNTSVATVSNGGIVTGVAIGSVTVTATGSDTGQSDTVTITVTGTGAYGRSGTPAAVVSPDQPGDTDGTVASTVNGTGSGNSFTHRFSPIDAAGNALTRDAAGNQLYVNVTVYLQEPGGAAQQVYNQTMYPMPSDGEVYTGPWWFNAGTSSGSQVWSVWQLLDSSGNAVNDGSGNPLTMTETTTLN